MCNRIAENIKRMKKKEESKMILTTTIMKKENRSLRTADLDKGVFFVLCSPSNV